VNGSNRLALLENLRESVESLVAGWHSSPTDWRLSASLLVMHLGCALEELDDAVELFQAAGLPCYEPGAVIVLIGPPGAGKSSYAARFPRSWVLNLDSYREQVADDPHDQAATPDAVNVEQVVLDARCRRGLPCVIDSTNVEARVREDLLDRVLPYGVPVIAVMFDVPLETCLSRNAARDRPVPEHVVREKHAQMLASLPGLLDEGFACVHLLSDLQEPADLNRPTD
jgi:predicted kinase